MRRSTIRGHIALVIAALLSASGCAGAGSSAPSCAQAFTFRGDTYIERSVASYTQLESIGEATIPPCDDNNGPADPPDTTPFMVFSVHGVDPGVAVAIGPTADDTTFVVAHGDALTPGVRRAIENN